MLLGLAIMPSSANALTVPITSNFVVKDHLYPSQYLHLGEYLCSSNGEYTFTLQMDGNLVLSNSINQVLWASNTSGMPVSRFIVNANTNALELLNSAGQAIWSASMRKTGYYGQGQMIIVTNNGTVNGYDYYGNPTWATNKLYEGTKLLAGQELAAGSSSPFKLKMQNDGNLVLRFNNMFVLWSTNTSGNPGSYCTMQHDNNLVIYNSANQAIWASGTNIVDRYEPNPLENLYLRVDGNLVISHMLVDSLIYWDRTRGKY